MDPDLSARASLLRSLTSQLERENDISALTASNISTCVAQNHLLKDPITTSTAATNLTNEIEKFSAAVQRIHSKCKGSTKASAAVLLRACIAQASHKRLITEFQSWGQQLVESIKKDAANGNINAAREACAALAELINRLGEVINLTGVRREVAALVAKAMPSINTLLSSDAALDRLAALPVIAAVLATIPTSLRPQIATLEPALVKAAKSAAAAAGQQQVLHAAAHCLGRLPRAQGDADSWSEFARRVLLSAHDLLDVLLMGLEPPSVDPKYREHLQAGSGGDGLLGPVSAEAQHVSGKQTKSLAASRQLLGAILDTLEELLTSSYPVPVPLPSYSLLLLAARVLGMDVGRVIASGRVPPSAHMWSELQAMLPALHTAALQLLQLLCCSARGQLLTLHGMIASTLAQQLRHIRLGAPGALLTKAPEMRSAVYRCTREFVRAAGCGVLKPLASEAIGAAMAEVYGFGAVAAGAEAGGGAPSGPRTKRQRTGGFDGLVSELDVAAGSVAAAAAGAADLHVQAAALQLLETVVQVGGPLLPAELRAQLDALAAHAAGSCSAAALKVQQDPYQGQATGLALKDLQLASLQLLLATVLSPLSHRPPFLAQALQLFKAARTDSAPGVASFGAAAAVACEGLLHPRATAMATVRQYSGMEGVPQLSKPRMWSALQQQQVEKEETPAAAAAAAAATEPAAEAAEPAAAAAASAMSLLQEFVQYMEAKKGGAAAAAAAAPAAPAVVVAHGTAHVSGQQQQQEVQHTVAVLAVAQPASTAAATSVPAGTAAMEIDTAPAAVAAAPAPANTSAATPAPPVAAAAAAAPAAAAPAAAPAPAAAAAAAAGLAMGSTLPRPAFDPDSSSDSEGELPEIDSGSSEEEEEDE